MTTNKPDIMIFSTSANGHFPEYLHHLYMGIVERLGIKAVFAVPDYFKETRKLFLWPECDRISFDYIPDKEVSWGDGKWYKRNYRFAKLVQFYARKHCPKEIIMLDLMMSMPYLSFMIPKNTKVSGILYEIYQYRWQSLALPRKLAALAWHWLLAKRRCFKNIFMLNDASMAEYDNRIYHTTHFQYLPDPFMPLPQPTEDFRKKYNVPIQRRLFLHFGSFGRKKGTLEILKSALALSKEEQEKYCFVFAGCVQPVIRNVFFKLTEELRSSTSVQLFVFDEFCSYEFLAGWCNACDVILVPYLEAYNSSGCIGYAAQFNKPVIGPTYGLLGRLIRSFKLGVQIPYVDSIHLVEAYQIACNLTIDGTAYLRENTVESFCSSIL